MSEMMHGLLPDTDYLEITARSGRTYGIWVTAPPDYADSKDPLPLVYVVDGNFAVGLTAPLIITQADPSLDVAPYIQVSIGYAGQEAASWATRRNRDLVPPGEPVGEEARTALETALDSGAMTQEQVDAYLAELSDTRADVFLDFLIGELHPRLRERFRVSESGHGLFGYSYGGLFALYAWLRGAPIFATFGAGSPGVVGADSTVFELIDTLPERGANAPRLHLTLNDAELLGEIPVHRAMGRHVLEVLEALRRTGHAGCISSAILRETHLTGLQASFLDYLTTCRSVQAS